MLVRRAAWSINLQVLPACLACTCDRGLIVQAYLIGLVRWTLAARLLRLRACLHADARLLPVVAIDELVVPVEVVVLYGLRLWRQLNLDLHIVKELLWHELLFGQGWKLLLARDAFFLAHGLVHAVKLSIVNHIERLLGRFTFPRLWQQLRDDEVDCLILHASLPVKFLLQTLFIPPQLHFWCLVPLSESSCNIWVIGVWVLPEFASESLAFLPKGKQVLLEQRLTNLRNELMLSELKAVKDLGVGFALCFLVDLLHCVYKSLKVILSQLLLLDGLSEDVGACGTVSLHDLTVQVAQELPVSLHELIVRVSKVKVVCVSVD